MSGKLHEYFRRGRWLRMAAHVIRHPQKLTVLLRRVRGYMSKDGLKEISGALMLMWSYVSDVARGRYKGYNLRSLLLTVAAFIYLVSPVDLIPDLLPGGLVDDVGVLYYVLTTIRDELSRYKRRQDDDAPPHDTEPQV